MEEELGASIENGAASSMSTVTEKHRLDRESQTSGQQLVAEQQSTDQDTKGDISQGDTPAAACSITSELKTHDDQSEGRAATKLDIVSAKTKGVEINEDYLEPENATVEETEGFNSQDTDNNYCSLRDALSVHESKDINRTVDIDEISRTIDTSDMVRSVDTSDTSVTVDTSDPSGTEDTNDTSGTVDTSSMGLTVNASDTSRTVDTSDETRSVDSSADTSGTVDTSDITET